MMTRENRAAIVIVAIAVVLVVATAYIGTQSKSLTPDSVAGKTYLAPDGKARPNAKPLLSRSRRHDEAGTNAAGAPSAETAPPSQAQPPEPQPPSPPPLPDIAPPNPHSEAQRAVEKALGALSPEQGIESLNKSIPGVASAAEASQLYAARGRLRMQQAQPNLDSALADVAEAKRLAQNPYDAHYAARAEADLLLSQGESARAAACIQQALAQNPSPTAPGLELRLMLAGIRENDGDTDAAEATYLQAMDEAQGSVDALGIKALDQYRLAALKLARLYRRLGRDKDADALAQTVKERVGQ